MGASYNGRHSSESRRSVREFLTQRVNGTSTCVFEFVAIVANASGEGCRLVIPRQPAELRVGAADRMRLFKVTIH